MINDKIMPKSSKKIKTTEETKTGRNKKSIDLENLTEKENKKLIKLAEKDKIPGYHVVNPKKGDKYLRSNPDRNKKNNLDPKLKRRK